MELLLEDVQFCYDKGTPTEKIVLDSVWFRVKEGESVSIIGRTGSGKTTLGLIMAGLLSPTRGIVTTSAPRAGAATGAPRPSPGAPAVTGTPLSHAARQPTEGVNVAMVFQFPESQFFEENVFREIAFGPTRLGLGPDEVKRRVAAAMAKLKLDFDAFSDRPALSLSQGEKRKVAIASVLSCSPRFLVLDEPTVSLDWEASANIFERLNELKQSGVSVIVMTHEVDHGSLYSDRIAVLTGGRLVGSSRSDDRGSINGGLSKSEAYRILSQEESI